MFQVFDLVSVLFVQIKEGHMETPENLAQVVRAVNEAAGVLESAGLAAEHNSETRPIGIRLLKMSDEAKGYSQYIGAYFSASPKGETD